MGVVEYNEKKMNKKKVMLAVAVYHVVASQWSLFKTVW
jgi:hypothetical protein